MSHMDFEAFQPPEATETAPTYTIPARRFTAIEHPLIIKNVDKAVKTFGPSPAFKAILDSDIPQLTAPLYLRYDNPTARPLPSFNTPTHNLVVKVTVPKRTGRKRKRGSDDPFEGDAVPNSFAAGSAAAEIRSQGTLDAPKTLRRRLRDNVGKYKVEPAGVISRTHRYRGFTDFQFTASQSKFMKKFVGNVLTDDMSHMRQFTIEPGVESHAMVDVIPPPFFTSTTLSYPYNYTQNTYSRQIGQEREGPGEIVEEDEYGHIINITSHPPTVGYFLSYDEFPAPSQPQQEPDMSDPHIARIITEMRKAMDERPIWTRRSMWNRLATTFEPIEDPQKGFLGPRSGSLIKYCLPFVGYQFRGGPWRGAMVRYGVDPRKDPKYRIYQTLIFKLRKTRIGNIGRSWYDVRTQEISVKNYGKYWEHKINDSTPCDTHIFDGKSYHTDGKVWQVCDITDPLLVRLFAEAEVRRDVDISIAGWYHQVLWLVGKALMKSKILAIRYNRTLSDEDVQGIVKFLDGPINDDGVSTTKSSISVALPDFDLKPEEINALQAPELRPGPPLTRRLARPEDAKRQANKAQVSSRSRIKIKSHEQSQVKKMMRLLQGTEGEGIGEGNKVQLDESGNLSQYQTGQQDDDGESLKGLLEDLGEDEDEDEDEDEGSSDESVEDGDELGDEARSEDGWDDEDEGVGFEEEGLESDNMSDDDEVEDY